MYKVDFDDVAKEQLRELPEHLRPPLAALMDLLELQPWSGAPYNRARPDANIRVHSLGEESQCSVIYLIVDHLELVEILRIIWVD
ncbi:hypothetical protein CDO52_10035 [Nocardiopsis gilva YIM 90087]|uniref:Type II toxin-antitoxin system RelE/ParE family toxin n=1 Tax=Nocardiopsis gilva YIM 90087 TaxID=1235441 RepID=A0A223S4N2_9ACTN|nr:hypothetical protein [Nocardiopsis gilva]ASU83075.1 hypothetical protein CDO52_10035 [Nocardiopsis gilva YIM 90087]